tara:strand:+ start:17461 stop:17895 length:435 start_codon:yes stop_codon:yes gene_type:complete
MFINGVNAQTNFLYGEIGGAGYLSTINYERLLSDNITGRIGFGSTTRGNPENKNVSFFPLSLHYFKGDENRKAEFSGGVTILSGKLERGRGDNKVQAKPITLYIGVGHRYQKSSSGLFLGYKIYYMKNGSKSAPWAGVLIGWRL